MRSIVTHGGDFVSLDEPQAIDIRVIAHSLSLICRFTGHTPASYSVAQHSLLVSHEAGLIARDRNLDSDIIRQVRLIGLLHDAHEFLCGDVSRPVKEVLGAAWLSFEAKLQRMVLESLGQKNTPPTIRDIVREADDTLLAAELSTFFGLASESVRAKQIIINPWSVSWARSKFLKVYEELTQ